MKGDGDVIPLDADHAVVLEKAASSSRQELSCLRDVYVHGGRALARAIPHLSLDHAEVSTAPKLIHPHPRRDRLEKV
jgi:hypothetical protein